MLDACHSGGASRGADAETCVRGSSIGFSRSGKPFAPRLDARPTILIPGGAAMAGACYIEACRSYQSNAEIIVGKTHYGPLSYYVNMVLKKNDLTPAATWVAHVRKLMEADNRLARQNIVVERSVK